MKTYNKNLPEFYIVENSFLARIARVFMKSNQLAMVIGKGIHLSGVGKTDFLENQQWLNHELIHIHQFKKYGLIRFLLLYSLESLKNGYYNNRFEVEAREGEKMLF